MPAFLPKDGPGNEVRLLEFEKLYPEKADKEKNWPGLKLVELPDIDRELVIRWLLRDDRAVFGGATISGARKQ